MAELVETLDNKYTRIIEAKRTAKRTQLQSCSTNPSPQGGSYHLYHVTVSLALFVQGSPGGREINESRQAADLDTGSGSRAGGT